MIEFKKYILFNWMPKALSGLAILTSTVGVHAVAMSGDDGLEYVAFSIQPLTADYQLIHEQSKNILARYRITIGEGGVRIDEQGVASNASIIFDSSADQLWFLDRKKKLAHKVPLQLKIEDKDEKTRLNKDDDRFGVGDLDGLFAGFIQFEPCANMMSEQLVDVGRAPANIQTWLCKQEGQVVEKQWFHTGYGIVVKSESFDGIVSTMSNITRRNLDVNYFKPPNKYRSVAFEDIVSIRQPLDIYEEQNMLPVGSLK